jgi:hypothetical protein
VPSLCGDGGSTERDGMGVGRMAAAHPGFFFFLNFIHPFKIYFELVGYYC